MNDIIKAIEAEQLKATGFGLRVDRLLEVMPLKEIDNETAVVLFHEASYIQALQKAQKLRVQNKRVTLQALVGLQDVEAFKKQFTEVVYVGQED